MTQNATVRALGGAKAVPYEDFEQDLKREEETWTAWFFRTCQGAPFLSTYEILADALSYRESLKNCAKIQRLKPKCQVYENIMEYIKNSGTASTDGKEAKYYGRHPLKVHQIYKIERKDERSPFTEPYRLMMWHATRPVNIPAIIKDGFKKGHNGIFGRAMYFSDRICPCRKFSFPAATLLGFGSGKMFFILAEVSPGQMFKTNATHHDFVAPPNGYDSVKGRGCLIPDKKQNKLYHGAIMPSGPTVRETRHPRYHLDCNEIAVYNPERVIVRFIVECSTT